MKGRTYVLYAMAAWIVLLVYFWGEDHDAFVLSLVLTPPLGLLVMASIRLRHACLSMFMGFALISHSVAPPFFFIHRQLYSYGGDFGAVKDFRFGLLEFFGIYAYLLLYLAATVSFALLLNSAFAPPSTAKDRPGRDRGAGTLEKLGRRMRTRANWALTFFILLVGVPLSLFMYWMRVGLTGLEPVVLPYRLTGIMTYFRMFVIPIIVFGLYSISTRSRFLTALILFYAALGGFASVSRYFIFATVAPLVVFPLLDRRKLRFAVVALATGAIFVMVSDSRNYLYPRPSIPLVELVQTTIEELELSDFSVFEIVGGVANRLWGPQDVVLAYQYHVPSRLVAIAKYFTVREVVPDLTYEFYGMIFSGDSAAFGVGLGYIPWMIVLADRSILTLLFLAFVTAGLLTISERLARVFQEHPGKLWNAGGQAMGFLFVYFLYTSSVNWWYKAVLYACVPALYIRLRHPTASRRKRSGAPQRPGTHQAPALLPTAE